MRKTIRKTSKITKKGILEKIYKEYTLPIVFEKNGGLCVCCNRNRSEGGHHIFGREKDYNHIHPGFIVPVCNWCHSKEKSTNHKERIIFENKCHQFMLNNLTSKKATIPNPFYETVETINDWAWEKLIEYGYKPR